MAGARVPHHMRQRSPDSASRAGLARFRSEGRGHAGNKGSARGQQPWPGTEPSPIEAAVQRAQRPVGPVLVSFTSACQLSPARRSAGLSVYIASSIKEK
jgi:hypothetical protein